MEYGSSGVYQFYQHQLRDVLGYSDMKTQVLHYFREVGNALIFVMMIERSLNQQEMYDMLQVCYARNCKLDYISVIYIYSPHRFAASIRGLM